jgi:hypothetical protein
LPWEIALSGEALRNIETLPTAMKKAVIYKLMWLGEGNILSKSSAVIEGLDLSPFPVRSLALPTGT